MYLTFFFYWFHNSELNDTTLYFPRGKNWVTPISNFQYSYLTHYVAVTF